MAFLGLLRYLVMLVALLETVQGRHLQRPSYEMDNSLSPNSPEYEDSIYESSTSRNSVTGKMLQSNWVNATQKPRNTLVVRKGKKVELICEALGNPSPSIQWFRGKQPVTDVKGDFLPGLRTVNLLPEVKIGKVISKFVIACAEKVHEGSYTCVATSGLAEKQTHSTTLIVEGGEPGEKDRLFSSCPHYRFRPEIVLSRSLAFEDYGSNVLLPCSAIGNPKPTYRWENEAGKIINSDEDERFEVSSSGDLRIYNLEWDDMGKYTCIASNERGESSTSTFLYPVNPK